MTHGTHLVYFSSSPNSSFVRLLGITAVAWKFIRRPPSTPPLQRTRTQASLYPRLPDPCAPNADAPPDTDRRARPRPAAPAEPNRQELSPMRPFFLCVMELQCVSYFLSPWMSPRFTCLPRTALLTPLLAFVSSALVPLLIPLVPTVSTSAINGSRPSPSPAQRRYSFPRSINLTIAASRNRSTFILRALSLLFVSSSCARYCGGSPKPPLLPRRSPPWCRLIPSVPLSVMRHRRGQFPHLVEALFSTRLCCCRSTTLELVPSSSPFFINAPSHRQVLCPRCRRQSASQCSFSAPEVLWPLFSAPLLIKIER
jgi:hypothetical protein